MTHDGFYRPGLLLPLVAWLHAWIWRHPRVLELFHSDTTRTWSWKNQNRVVRAKAWLFDRLRPWFVPNVDRNEDFCCEHCTEPVLFRMLFCSPECEQLDAYKDKPPP